MNARNVWVVAATLGLGILVTSAANATLTGGPGLIAWAGNYNQATTNPHGGFNCINNPATMPFDRQSYCGVPQLQKTATGRYTLTVSNAAPFPSMGDTGYQVFVQAVGSTAHCFEEGTTWTSSGSYTLTSKIRCVAPSSNSNTNTDTDSDWAWSYRADSLQYPQQQQYLQNFAYARVNGNGSTVGNQTFNPGSSHVVSATRASTGKYSVVFEDLYTHGFDPVDYPDVGFLNNIVVQKTCDIDTAASCRRSVCIASTWTPGHFFPDTTSNLYKTTVEVSCYGPDGQLRDTNFRVFAGEESHVSAQGYSEQYSSGWQYGWMNYVSGTSNVCHDPSDYVFRAQHEGATDGVYNEDMELCKTATGRYTINLLEPLGPYHTDDLIPVLTSRATGGTYCNASAIVCSGGNCSGTGPDSLRVRCYDRTGASVNASWNMSMFY